MMKHLHMSLRRFLHARDDARMLIVDAREKEQRDGELSNPFFTTVYLPHDSGDEAVERLARIIGERHAVVIAVSEADAAETARRLRALDVEAVPLEGGIDGWQNALIEESDEVRNSVEIVSLLCVSEGKRSYILIEDDEAVVVDPRGSIDCFVAELQEHCCRGISVVESERVADSASCARALSATLRVPYYSGARVEGAQHAGLWNVASQLYSVE